MISSLQVNEFETSVDKFHHLISQAPVIIATFKGPTFVLEIVNSMALEIWGKSYEQAIHKPFFESSPEMETELKQIFNDIYTSGKPFIAKEIQVQLNRTGKPYTAFFDMVYQPLRDVENVINGIIVVGTEVTEAVNARNLIKSSDPISRTILESSPDCLKLLDLEGRFKYMNHNALCQMEIDDFSTIENKNWWTLWGSENEALVKDSISKARQGETAKFTAFCPTAKGTPKWWDVVVSPVRKPGEPVQQIISVSRDITEAKEAAEKIKEARELFEITLHNVPSAVYHFNDKGQILYLNELAAKQMGYDSIEEVLMEKDVYQFRKKLDERFDLLNELGQPLGVDESCSSITLKTGKPAEVVIQFINKKTGASFWLLTKSVPLLNAKGELTNVFTACTDITQHKESELKLKISEEKYRGLFETMDQGLSIIEMIFDENNKPIDYRFIENNPVFQKQTGLQDVLNKTVREVMPDLDAFWFETYGRVALTGESTRFTQKEDTLNSWFDVYASRLGDEGSKKVAILFTNITGKKQAEQDLEKTASHLKLATDSANIGVWSLNIQTQALEWTPLHKKMWGYEGHRTDLTFEDWHKIIIPEDKALALQRVEDARINHSFYEVEYRIKKADDNVIRFMRSSGKYYYNVKGEAETLTGISIDITQQKESEQKIKESERQFHIFADSIQNLAWIADGKGWIYWYNQRWYDYTGTTLEEMEGWGWQKVHHPNHSKRVVELLKEAWKKDEAWELTFPLRRHDGEYRWFLTRAYPVKDTNGNIERWIGTNTDVTEQKSFTEELEKKVNERTEELSFRTKQLEETNKTLDVNNIALENANAELKSFSYIASHDLQEPLRMIKMFSKRIIDTEKFSDKTQNYFNFIITASERMRNLIVSLIDFSRIDKTELNFVPCNLNTIVEETKNDLQLRIAEKKAIIECENLPTINGMYIQLSQLFTNLIGNAIKYSRPEIIPRITINSERIFGKEIDHPAVNAQQEYYAIKIADNGIGFEKEHATKIFEAFKRLHDRDEYSGTGIGLSIVKKIMTNHNGFIVAEGIPDVGSTFILYMPTT